MSLYPPILNRQEGARFYLQKRSRARIFQLVTICGVYTIYTDIIFQRVYSIEGNCTECIVNDDKGMYEVKGSIEDCNICQNLDCPEISVEEFLKEPHPEYIQ